MAEPMTQTPMTQTSRRAFVAAFAALSLVPFSLTACAGPAAAEGVTRVDGARARQLVAAGATLLDVRTPGEYSGGHVDGAINIPVDQVAASLDRIPRDHAVVVYCASGVRSARAAGVLAGAGYDVYDLGGIGNW